MSAHEEVSFRQMIARDPTPGAWRRTLATVAAAAALTGVAFALSTPIVRAVDPPPPGPLDRPLADLALIGRNDPQAPPLLLTIDTEGSQPGTVRVALLDRAAGWSPIDEELVALPGEQGGAGTPWLVETAPNRFVMLVVWQDDGLTALVPIGVARGAASPLSIGEPRLRALAVDYAGAIDVEADGTAELILAESATGRGGSLCQSSAFEVLDGETLQARTSWTVPDVRVAGGALGEWDGEPGGDLLVYVYDNCPVGSEAPRLGVHALRVADGAPIATVTPANPRDFSLSPGVPLAADFDGDGRQEAVVRDGESLAILEPARGWARTDVALGGVAPLMASTADGEAQGQLVWVEELDQPAAAVVAAEVARTSDGALDVSIERLPLEEVELGRRSRVLQSIRDVALARDPPLAWRGDVDGDGCQRIIAPLLTTACGVPRDLSMKVGAAWVATRPLTAFDARDSRELLIAATTEWDPAAGAPRPPSPAAAMPAGAWRHGPSSRFVLSEVRAPDVAYFGVFPVPRPTIGRAPVATRGTDLPGFTGSRVLVRAVSEPADAPGAEGALDLETFLTEPPAADELVTVLRIPVPARAEAGRDGSFVHLPLADLVLPDGSPAARWSLTVAQVNDWGEIAGPVQATIVLDSTGPSLSVEPPFLTLPWPLPATVHGRTEPGVVIRWPGGGSATADRRGRFQIQTPLAPWPQPVEVVAIDQTGNVTTRVYTLVGGVDYRAFPWPAMLAGALLVAAALSAIRASRGVLKVETAPDTEPFPEIEELPSAVWPHR